MFAAAEFELLLLLVLVGFPELLLLLPFISSISSTSLITSLASLIEFESSSITSSLVFVLFSLVSGADLAFLAATSHRLFESAPFVLLASSLSVDLIVDSPENAASNDRFGLGFSLVVVLLVFEVVFGFDSKIISSSSSSFLLFAAVDDLFFASSSICLFVSFCTASWISLTVCTSLRIS